MGACEWLRINTIDDGWWERTNFKVLIYSHNYQKQGLVIATSTNTAQEARNAAAAKLREFADLLERGEGKP